LASIHVYRLQRHVTVSVAASLVRRHRAGDQVWLVLPWRTRWAQNLLNLRRLGHAASEVGVDLRLVSLRSQVRQLAREAGLPPYIMLPPALQRSVQRVEGKDSHAEVRTLSAAQFRRPRHLGLAAFAAGLLGALLLLGIIAATIAVVLPSAEITLQPITQAAEVRFTVTASPLRTEIDYGQALLPARMVQVIVEDVAQQATTGRATEPDTFAAGDVVFANRSDQAVSIPKGTYVRTGSGQTARFYTVNDASLPAQYNATVRVPIMAADAGPVGNVRALTINIIEGGLASSLEVINDSATNGGAMREIARVSAEDQNALYDEALARLTELARQQLADELEEGESIVQASLDVQVMSYKHDQVLDQRSEIVSMTMKVVARGEAIRSRDLELLATRMLEAQGKADLRLVEDTLALQPSEQVSVQGGEITFDVMARGSLAQVIEVDSVRHGVRGQEVDTATAWLSDSFELAAAPKVTVLPPRWERLPVLPVRISVAVDAGAP